MISAHSCFSLKKLEVKNPEAMCSANLYLSKIQSPSRVDGYLPSNFQPHHLKFRKLFRSRELLTEGNPWFINQRFEIICCSKVWIPTQTWFVILKLLRFAEIFSDDSSCKKTWYSKSARGKYSVLLSALSRPQSQLPHCVAIHESNTSRYT